MYIVQEGDSLWSIALRFGLDPGPGHRQRDRRREPARHWRPADHPRAARDQQGTLTTDTGALRRDADQPEPRSCIPVETLGQLNHLTSPAELYAGTNLVIAGRKRPGFRPPVAPCWRPGQSLFELGVTQGASPWSYINRQWPGSDLVGAAGRRAPPAGRAAPQEPVCPAPGRPARARSAAVDARTRSLSCREKPWSSKLPARDGLELGGSLNEHTLQFLPRRRQPADTSGFKASTP